MTRIFDILTIKNVLELDLVNYSHGMECLLAILLVWVKYLTEFEIFQNLKGYNILNGHFSIYIFYFQSQLVYPKLSKPLCSVPTGNKDGSEVVSGVR